MPSTDAVHVAPGWIGVDSVSVPELTEIASGERLRAVLLRHRRRELAQAERRAAQRVAARSFLDQLRRPSRAGP